MKQHLKFFVPFILIIVLIISGCELSRPDDSAGDLQTEEPGAPPDTPIPGEPVTPAPSEISSDVIPATEAPDVPPQEGIILVKLAPPAALEARTVITDSEGIVSSGVPTLDQTLEQIRATGMEPVIQPVVEASGETMESFSDQISTAVIQLYSVSFDPNIPPEEAAQVVSQDPNVEYAEPNYIAGIVGSPVSAPAPLTPNDPYFSYQWHMEAIQAPAAWDGSTGQNVIVAVVDTGVDFGAPDLANTRRLPGWDFANNDADPTDDQGHGTHVAGTVAQSTNNNVGVAGVAFNATLLPVKALGSNGQGSFEKIIQGIIYAVDQGADVINLSLAGRNGSQALQDAVKYAYDRGVVVVAAAGNSNGAVQFPAAYDDYVIAVGAVRYDNTRAPYSNFGPQIDVVAPGGDTGIDQNQDGYGDGVLQQTFKSPGSGYTYLFLEGTSMASPHVAGVAGLMLSVKPEASVDEVKRIMMDTARNVGPPNEYGAGLVQAANALAAIGGVQPPTPTDTPTPTATTPPRPGDTPTPTSTPTPPTVPPSATDTPTPTPIPLPPGELLLNGSFETDEGWVFGDTPIRGGYDTTAARNGSRSARVGAVEGRNVFSFSSTWQRVTIPAEANQVVLSAYVYPVTADECSADSQLIGILNQNFRLTRTLWRGLSNNQQWEAHTFDVTEFRGQTIYVYFSVLNRGCSGLTAMYVDDVALNWSP
jgi:subtilisin family serine protease